LSDECAGVKIEERLKTALEKVQEKIDDKSLGDLYRNFFKGQKSAFLKVQEFIKPKVEEKTHES